MLIEQKLMYAKGTEIGIVLFGSDETNNQFHEKLGGYENVNIFRYLDDPSVESLK
jgi:ATP-dependent DNA helicase 2 subunit 2